MIKSDTKSGVKVYSEAEAKVLLGIDTGHYHVFEVECRDKWGALKWVETVRNVVVNEGLDDILNRYYKGSAYTAAHYCGLANGTPVFAAADTLASKAWWM